MSLPRSETIECPRCRRSQEVSIWASVNVTTDPDLKREVLDGTIARFRCQTCRHSTKIEYDLLYHDMTKRLAVWLKYPDERGFLVSTQQPRPSVRFSAGPTSDGLCPPMKNSSRRSRSQTPGSTTLRSRRSSYLCAFANGSISRSPSSWRV